ncbi:sensor histidine kinase [Rhodococcoides trifolii]|uniref:sensor histidine kinase n=1 Tax=Rhodococcoides trifolii TaxID=908250 RepID=UPI0016655E16|nr:histidine kinase [Rhodococcus trifolii]
MTESEFCAIGVTGPLGELSHFGRTMTRTTVPARTLLSIPLTGRSGKVGTLFAVQGTRGDDSSWSSLASMAGSALETAILLDVMQRKERASSAALEIAALISSEDGRDPLPLFSQRVLEILDADAVNVAVPTADPEVWIVTAASGLGSDILAASSFDISTAAGFDNDDCRAALLTDARDESPRTLHMATAVELGPSMVLPMMGSGRPRGAVIVGRARGRPGFTAVDLATVGVFANRVAAALDAADARSARERAATAEDRERIARDLHDHVIQRLFGAGLSVESIELGMDDGDPHAARLDRVVIDVNDTIRQIRSAIFDLHGPVGPSTGNARAQLSAVSAESSEQLGLRPSLTFSGPVDALISDAVLADLVAVVRESLANVSRHASAGRVEIAVRATPSHVELELTDDGMGMDTSVRRSGLANLDTRAQARRGTFSAGPRTDKAGTVIRWSIPLT